MTTIDVLDPTQRGLDEALTVSAIETLAGLRVGFLTNGWMSWDTLVPQLEVEMRQRHGATLGGHWRVPISSAAPSEVLDRVGETSDLVLAGLAN